MLRKTLGGGVAALMVWAGVAVGALDWFDGRMVDIEYWAGSGANRAVCVVDFEPGVSYAFGYRWDGAVTGFEMLEAIAAGGPLEIEYNTDFGSPFMDTIRYDGHSMGTYFGWPADWLGYFESEDGSTWNVSGAGASARQLADGDWDGWSHQTTDAWPPAYVPTAPPHHSAAFEGSQLTLISMQRVNGSWVRDKPSIRRLTAVLHYNDPPGDGTLMCQGIELMEAGVAKVGKTLLMPGTALTFKNGGFRGRYDVFPLPDIGGGSLQGEGAPGDIDTLSSVWWLVGRSPGGKVQSMKLAVFSVGASD